MSFFDGIRNAARRVGSNVNRFWSGLDFWDEEENKKQRERFAQQDRVRDAIRPPKITQNTGQQRTTDLTNRLTSGEIKRQQEQQRIQQARREPTQQQDQPSFLEGVINRGKDIATDLAKDPFTAISPLSSLVKNELTRPARQAEEQSKNTIQQVKNVKQDVDRQVREATNYDDLD